MDEIDRRDGILTSWKEIASFFHRDVRTVQRWEREEGLPVHRHPHRRRSSVYAYPNELEAWWSHYQSADRPVDEDAAGVEAVGEPDAEPYPAGGAAIVLTEPRRLSRSRWAWISAALCGAIAATAGLLLKADGHSSDPPFPIKDFAIVDSAAPLDVKSLDDVNGDGRGDLVTHVILGHETLIFFGSASPARTSPDVRINAEALGHPSGGSVGDVDGDGLQDLVINILLGEPAGYMRSGSSYLIKGRRDWPRTLQLPRDADSEFHIPVSNDIRMMACISPRGVDLNADGLRDIILGGADYSPEGRRSAGGVFVLFGRREWPERMDVLTAADIIFEGSRTGEALSPQCSAGDFTGDGHADLALVATEHTLWRLLGGYGRVYVFAGGPTWPRKLDAERDATFQLRGSAPGANLAPPVLTDVNGDSVADLVAGFSDPERRAGGGRVSIVFGAIGRHGTLSDASGDVSIPGGPTFGAMLSAADVNLDGRADLIVMEPGAGSVHLVLGHQFTSVKGQNPKGIVPTLLISSQRGTASNGMAIGDQDGDDAPEIALESGTANADGLRRIVELSPALHIDIDVRPNVTPNVLVPNGILAVEVPASSLARDLDAQSLRLAGVAPTQVSWQDFDGNGSTDLRLYFEVSTLRLPVTATRISLRGRTRAGLPVSGADDIVVVQQSPAALHDRR